MCRQNCKATAGIEVRGVQGERVSIKGRLHIKLKPLQLGALQVALWLRRADKAQHTPKE